ncbi:two-component system, chemotaxis family, sensor kinase CheA [Burkholderiales bacterium]|nr:MAG: chemotaxis protein CheA [Burkholderiales bacterium]CAG1009026.1 two-component system, chemotaxis family, sensor kinase CheA [Burkholderiales bacterium]
MNLEAAKQTFLDESLDLLRDMEEALLSFDQHASEPEAVNALFRAAHTIKGSAGLFGFEDVVRFTHFVESVLDRLRCGTIVAAPELVTVLLESGDYIETLVKSAIDGKALTAEICDRGATLLGRLSEYLPAKLGAAALPTFSPESAPDVAADGGARLGGSNWHISFRPGREVLRDGMDPLAFVHYLATLGEIVHIETLPDALPGIDELDPEQCYLGFEIELRSGASRQDIRAVFEFIEADSLLRILPPDARLEEYIAHIQELPEAPSRLGEILVACGALTRRELEQALAAQVAIAPSADQGAPRLGEILTQSSTVALPVVDAALDKQRRNDERRAAEARSVKVPADKLDSLINLVGELVIAASGTNLLAQKARRTDLVESASQVSRLVEDVRDAALRLRMVQIGEVFGRFPRVVRDLSRELGKEIELAITGAETELDKSMVERLGDPLMHLVRNAIDHGLESADQRTAAGKPTRGVVGLTARHESGSIVIEVKDDGRGLDRKRILRKAIEQGLATESQSLDDDEVLALIMQPGFSTAEQVTNLSGRGVGMDVVRAAIDALRGSIQIQSEPGEGTTMRLTLPLTLAIIDGFQVGLDRARFILPLDLVVECIDLPASHSQERPDLLNLRGQALPFVRLRRLFELPGPAPRRQNVVIVQHAGRRAGLVVDALLGECQTVIKPLGALFERLRGISGSTILPDGEVGLIIDVPQLVQLATARPSLKAVA